MTVLTAREVAKQLKVGVSTVYLFARQGRIPCLRNGKIVRFPEDVVEKMLKFSEPVSDKIA